MRVAIVVKEFPPDSIGGLQTQTKRMATALAESEEAPDVVLFTKRYRQHDDDENLPFEVIRVPQLGISPFISDLTFLIGCFLALVWHSRRIDLMQCMTIYPIGFLGLIVNRITRVPYFAWIRGNDFYQMRNVSWKRWMIKRVLGDTRVLVQSSEVRKDVFSEFPDLDVNLGIVGNGVEMPTDRSPVENKVVLFVGRLAPKKGVKYLIEAMQRVEEGATLWIVGDGQQRAMLERAATNRNVTVRFFGEVPPDQVEDYYLKAGILTLPSTEGEGMPNVVLEAMAYGVPVVATRSGALPSVVRDGETGYLVGMRDVNRLAERISELITSHSQRAEIGGAAREYVKHNHAWESIVAKLMEEYNRVRESP